MVLPIIRRIFKQKLDACIEWSDGDFWRIRRIRRQQFQAIIHVTLKMINLQGISFDTNTSFAPYKILYVCLGALAILVGVFVLIYMPDSPVHAHMLTAEEKIAAIERVRDDQGGTENKRLKKSQVFEALTDIRTWLIVLSVMLSK